MIQKDIRYVEFHAVLIDQLFGKVSEVLVEEHIIAYACNGQSGHYAFKIFVESVLCQHDKQGSPYHESPDSGKSAAQKI